MIDISVKKPTKRVAVSEAKVVMNPNTLKKLIEDTLPKKDALSCARIAAILAAKKTSELIPMCHPIEITDAKIDFKTDSKKGVVLIRASISSIGRTGVEMEALTAVTVASLTIYDMCKAVERGIVISEVKLIKKSGGKSGVYIRKD